MMRFKFLLKHGHSIISVEKPLDIIALFGFNFPHAVEAIVSKQSFVINNKWATKWCHEIQIGREGEISK